MLILQGEAAVDPLIEFLLGPPSLHAEPRCLAAKALGVIGGDRAVQGLIQALTAHDVSQSDPAIQLAEETVRNWVTEQLGHLGDRRAIPALLEALRRFHLTNAATALARFGVAEAIPDIMRLLEDDCVRDRLVEALRIFGGPAVPLLIETLRVKRYFGGEERPASVRRRACAARLLGALEAPGSAGVLSEFLTDDAAPVRFEAALVLLAQVEPEKPTQVADLISVLLGALDTGEFDVTPRCRDTLCALGPVALPPLREALTTLSDEASLIVIDCLVTLGDYQAAEMMAVLSEDPNVQVRRRAGWALNRLKKETSEADAGA